MRKKRIFGPKRSSGDVRPFTLILFIALISAFSFSAGLYIGKAQSSTPFSQQAHASLNAAPFGLPFSPY